MRILIAATLAVSALSACGQSDGNSSSVQDASGALLTWHATYRGVTDQGTISFSPGNLSQAIMVHNMPTGQSGNMVIYVMNGNQEVYIGAIANLAVYSGSATLYQMSLYAVGAGSTGASSSAAGDGSAGEGVPNFVNVNGVGIGSGFNNPSVNGVGNSLLSNVVIQLNAPN